jgi:hypothetical protein
MSTVYEIPLNAYAEEFNLELAGTLYTFRTHWNKPLGAWTLDLGTSNDEWLILNLALVAGVNLLEQYGHLNLGFKLFAITDGKSEADPTESNLGTDAHLVAVID